MIIIIIVFNKKKKNTKIQSDSLILLEYCLNWLDEPL